jgi:hypothetical protein
MGHNRSFIVAVYKKAVIRETRGRGFFKIKRKKGIKLGRKEKRKGLYDLVHV